MKTNLTTNSILRNSQIPTINISKETLKLIIDSLESEEVLTLFETLYGYLYENEEPSFKGKALTSVWNNLISTSERFSKSYFGRKAHIDKVNEEKKKAKQSALQNTVGDEFNIPQVANDIPSNEETENKPVLAPQIIQDDNQYQEEVESGLNSPKMGNNEIIEDDTYMEEKPVVKIAANKHSSDVERVQELINTDDDFYTAYSRYIKASMDYINDPTGRCSANSKEMAKVRLQAELDKHHIIFNKDIMEMINRDINETMRIRNIDVA